MHWKQVTQNHLKDCWCCRRCCCRKEFVKQSVQDLNVTLKQLKDSVATVDQLNTVNRSFILGMGELSEVNEVSTHRILSGVPLLQSLFYSLYDHDYSFYFWIILMLSFADLSHVCLMKALQENMETLFGWRGIVVFDKWESLIRLFLESTLLFRSSCEHVWCVCVFIVALLSIVVVVFRFRKRLWRLWR